MLGAMERQQLAEWVSGYERAWRTPGTEALADLFTPDATYLQEPYGEPVVGLPAIAVMWEAEREGPDEAFTATSEIVAVDGDTGVVRVEVLYGEPVQQAYLDLWIVRLDADGRCRHFEEWPFWPTKGRVSSS
jgi:ketosteroid isomerase-like protein